mgnify:CR=1 FL=1
MSPQMHLYLISFDGDQGNRSKSLQYAYHLGYVELNPKESPRYRLTRLGKQAVESR